MRNAFGMVMGILIGTAGFVAKADQTAVAPPQGSTPLLEVRAEGVQVYICESKQAGFEWKYKVPEANLFDNQGRQIASTSTVRSGR